MCNDTSRAVRFGQAGTDENILLRPRECHLYAWRSPRARLLMRLCVEGGSWRWCEPFKLECGKTLVREVKEAADDAKGAQRGPIIVRCTRINSVQKKVRRDLSSYLLLFDSCIPISLQVCFGGSLAAASLLRDHLEFRVLMRPSSPSQSPAPGGVQQAKEEEERCLLPSFSCTPSFAVNPSAVRGVKVRLLGIGTPWSGDIPVRVDRGRKPSALVRIPTKEKGQCQTIWVRVVEEELEGGAGSRTLLVFSPMYVARSLMPGPVKMILNSAVAAKGAVGVGGGRSVDLPGRSVPVQLDTLGASDLKYNVSLKVSDDLPASEPIAMSWGIVERVRARDGQQQQQRQLLGEKVSVDEILASVSKFGLPLLETSWPFVASSPENADEGGGEGTLEDDPAGDFSRGRRGLPAAASLAAWGCNPQPKTDVQVNFAQFHPLCNTLCLEINPWCLVVNQLGLPLAVRTEWREDSPPHAGSSPSSSSPSGGKWRVFDVSDNSVFAPPPQMGPGSVFHLGIRDVGGSTADEGGTGAVSWGRPMQMTDQEWRFRTILPAGSQVSLQ